LSFNHAQFCSVIALDACIDYNEINAFFSKEVNMANITVRNLPDKVKETLRIQAAQSGISLETYARHILQVASNQNDYKPVDIASLAGQYFGADQGVDIELPERDSSRQVVDFD
jgi:plasmid stability protein